MYTEVDVDNVFDEFLYQTCQYYWINYILILRNTHRVRNPRFLSYNQLEYDLIWIDTV